MKGPSRAVREKKTVPGMADPESGPPGRARGRVPAWRGAQYAERTRQPGGAGAQAGGQTAPLGDQAHAPARPGVAARPRLTAAPPGRLNSGLPDCCTARTALAAPDCCTARTAQPPARRTIQPRRGPEG